MFNEYAKYEKIERERRFPLTVILEDKKNIEKYDCRTRSEFRSVWNKLINIHFSFIYKEEFDTKFITQYGEIVFDFTNNNHKMMYLN